MHSAGVNPLGGVFLNGRPLPDHMRQRIVDLAKEGLSPCDISTRLQVSNGCVKEILERYCESGKIMPRAIEDSRSMPTEATQEICDVIKIYKEEHPSITVWEIRDRLRQDKICTDKTLPSVWSIDRVFHSIQPTKNGYGQKSSPADRDHKSNWENLLDGTSERLTAMTASAMAQKNVDLFRMKHRLDHYQRQCPNYDQTPNMKTLEFADKLNFTGLIDHCLANFDPFEFIKNIGESIEIRSRLGKSTMEKFDEMFEECAKKMEYKKGELLSQSVNPGRANLFTRILNRHKHEHVHQQQRGMMMMMSNHLSRSDKYSYYEARGKLMLKVPALAEINNGQWRQENDSAITSSTICDIGNLKWQLELRKGSAAANYSLYAKCNQECTEYFWFCNGKFTIYSMEEGGEQWKIGTTTDTTYAFYDNNELLIHDAIHVPPTNRKCQIWIIVQVDLLRVQPKMFALDTNIQVKMANGTKLVAVNKQGLASVSTYFHNFFFVHWKEKGQEEFLIHEEDDPNFDVDSFQLMIYAALSLGWMVPELLELFKESSRMFDILKLAFKYDIPPLVEYCQKQLILDEEKFPANVEMLELADQLNLTQLIEHCLANFNPLEFIKNIGQSIEIRSRLGKSTMDKLDKMFKECAKRIYYKKGGCSWMDNHYLMEDGMTMPMAHNKKANGRETYNAEEKKILEDAFRHTKYISKAQRLDIKAKTGLTDKQIKIWFQNRRMKHKKEQERMSLANHITMMQQSSSSSSSSLSTSSYIQEDLDVSEESYIQEDLDVSEE